MKLTMKITLDGLLSALRAKAHGMAEDVETGYRGRKRAVPAMPRDGEAARAGTGANDDVSRG